MGVSNEETVGSAAANYDAAELTAFLASAPDSLKGWADEQLAQLNDQAASPPTAAVDIEAFADDFDQENPPPTAAAGNSKPGSKGFGKVNLVLVALLAAAIVIIIQQLGQPAGHPETAAANPTASAMPSQLSTYAQLDEQHVTELQNQIEADPANIAARQELAELFLSAGRYQDAIEQFSQILQLAPENLDALLAIGVSEFNTGQDDQAEQHWLRATEVAPTQPEPWYNLGFLYLAKTPPDYPKAEQAWNTVIELAPDSELAATARAHLQRLQTMSPAPSPGR